MTRFSALAFVIYLMYRFKSTPTDPIFMGGFIMGLFDLYTWYNTSCNTQM